MRRAFAIAALALASLAEAQEPAPADAPVVTDAGPGELAPALVEVAPAERKEPAVAEPGSSAPFDSAQGEREGWRKIVDATGYLDGRFAFTRSRPWGLVPTDDQPQAQGLLELNTQIKVNVRPHTFAYADVSLVGAAAGAYHGYQDGQEVHVDDHVTAASLPVVSLNEVFAIHELAPELNLLLGKKRITWGPGVAFNSTDLLNPVRDPTDPTFQRAGAWLAQVEAPLEHVTFSALFAPTVLTQSSGIPTSFMFWPSYVQRDTAAHFQLAGRVYALVNDSDLNLMLFYGNQSVDDFRDKLRVGFSFSRYFFTDYELHLEALLQQGSTRQTVVPECVSSPLAALHCANAGRPILEEAKKDDSTVYPKVLVGTRRQFSDDSMLSLEYLWQADGWTKAQFQDFASALDLLNQGRAMGLPVNKIPGASALVGGVGNDGLPARFNFVPRAQHYLFATYSKPRIADDFTVQVVLLANLQDLSTMLAPSVAWATTDWLTLTLYGFVPFPGPDSLAATTSDGRAVSEYGTVPFQGRVMLEARAYF